MAKFIYSSAGIGVGGIILQMVVVFEGILLTWNYYTPIT
jgi:hypothetical protein